MPRSIDVPGDCPHLLDERLLVGVLHVVGAAEDDEAADLVEVGCRVPVQRLPVVVSAPAPVSARGATPRVSTTSLRTKTIGFVSVPMEGRV